MNARETAEKLERCCAIVKFANNMTAKLAQDFTNACTKGNQEEIDKARAAFLANTEVVLDQTESYWSICNKFKREVQRGEEP